MQSTVSPKSCPHWTLKNLKFYYYIMRCINSCIRQTNHYFRVRISTIKCSVVFVRNFNHNILQISSVHDPL